MNSSVFRRLSSILLTLAAMACCSRGEVIYVSCFYGGSIVQVKEDGSQATLATNLSYATGIALDFAGRLCVASSVTNGVMLVHSNGAASRKGRAFYKAGFTAVAFGPNRQLFLANQDANGLVTMDPGGSSLPFVGGLTSPFGMAFDRAGILHVAHMDKARRQGLISQILPDRTARVVVTNLHSPAGITFDAGGRLFVAENLLGLIVRIDPDGTRTNFVTGLVGPHGLAFSGGGELLVAEHFAGKISAISMSGERVVRATGLNGPLYLAVAELEPPARSVSVTQAPTPSATLLLQASPLTYHELYHSSDLLSWRSLGLHQLIGGNRLHIEIPVEDGATQGFYTTVPR